MKVIGFLVLNHPFLTAVTPADSVAVVFNHGSTSQWLKSIAEWLNFY